MSFDQGGGRPPPPPVPPPEQTPWGAPDPGPAWGPDPKPSGPGPSKPAIFGGLVVALAVSLAINAVLALRIKDETDLQAKLRTQVSQLQAEVDALTKRGPDAGGSVLDRIASAVAQIRELEFKKKVSPELLTAEDLKQRVQKQFAVDNPEKEIEELDKVLTAFGLVEPNEDLYEILVAVHSEQVAGFYDTKSKNLVVGGNASNPTPLDRVLLAHEYTHALTDQHYDLTYFDKLSEGRKDDEALAYLALIEGDATVMMGTYAQQFLTPSELQGFFDESSQAPTDALDKAPSVIRRSLLFPYEQGVLFVRAILEKGGTAALNKAYKDPPSSTEQILHTSKYTGTRDDPVAVEVPNLAREMGSGWKNLEGGGIGEFDIRLLVDQFRNRSDAERAGEGWDGGRFVAADSSKGTLVATITAWDSESEAREATDIFGRWLPDRFGNAGQDMRLSGVSGRGWESSNGAGAVLRNGSRVLLILGPDGDSVREARSAFPGF